MVSGSTTHPTAEQLRDFGSGRLPLEDAAPIEKHLLACDRCCAVLENSPADRFVERLGRAYAPRKIATEGSVLGPPVEPTKWGGDDTRPSLTEEIPSNLLRQSRYQVVRLLGKGGMGSVYLAEHRRMGRPVALKVIDPQLLSHDGALQRFQQEVRAAAQLHHANIVAAYDADQAGDLHFLVMEYVEGQNLADYLAGHGPLDVAQACDVARQAALGLHHAHERGMVHRDIKPHNLMRVPSGQVKVLDFGLARLVAEPGATAGADHSPILLHLTGAGAVMGTADYIAPEQARDAHGADARADVYSLGCTLYHLLAGRPPYPEGTATEKLSRHAAAEPTPLPALRPELPPGLAAIVGRMMAKQPQDRYQTAADAAEALRPYAETVQPVRKGRRRLAPAALVALAAVLLATAVAAAIVRLSAGNDREIVIETDDPEIEVVVKGDRIVRIVDPQTGNAYRLDRADLTLALADEPDGLRVALDGGGPVVLKRKGRRIAIVRVQNQTVAGTTEPSEANPSLPEKVGEVRRFVGHSFNEVYCAKFTPDGRRMVSASWDRTVRVWDVQTGKQLHCFLGHRNIITGLDVSRDGTRAVSASHDGTARVWDLVRYRPLGLIGPLKEFCPQAVAFAPDGCHALLSGWDAIVRLLDLTDLKVVRQFNGHKTTPTHSIPIHSVSFSPDGKRAISASEDHTVRVWDVATGEPLLCLTEPAGRVNAVAYAPDGRHFLSGSLDGKVRLWEAATGQEVRSFATKADSVAFSPDGNRILTGAGPGKVCLWEVASGRELASFPQAGHDGGWVGSVAFSPDGRYAVSGGNDRTVRLWRLPDPTPAAEADEIGEVRRFDNQGIGGRVYFLPHRDRAVSSGNVMRLWNVRTGQKVRDIAEKIGRSQWPNAVSPDGRHTMISNHLGDLETGAELRTMELPNPHVWGVAFSPDGRRAVFGGDAQFGPGATTVWVVDVASGKLVQRLGNGEPARQVAYSPDGGRIAVGHFFASDQVQSVIRLYDTATGRALHNFEVPSAAVSLMFSRDGKRLLSANDRTLRLWDLESGKQLRRFEGHVAGVEWAVFTPDQGRIVSAGADRTVRVWEASSGKQLHCYFGHRGGVVGVAVSPDGRYALSSSHDGTLRLWRLPPLPQPASAARAEKHPPQTGPGAVPLRLEAEDLAFSTRHCNARKQEMKTRGQDSWSHDSHLLCTGDMGCELVLPFRVPQAGDYELVLHATRAPNYGQFQIWLNGKRLGPVIDACHTHVEPTGPIPLGVCSLDAGRQEMRFELVGKNPASSNSLFGIDCLGLIPADAPTTKAEP
jgi:WD40 repeat protein/predicted Ser/Thr protein kinase